MKSKLGVLQKRVAALERMRGGDTVFILFDNSRAPVHSKRVLDAFLDAVHHRDTAGARVMLAAREASDGSRLHELAQALRARPVLNPEFENEGAVR
ncbi:MAG TPA: hypothetical protein VHZ09_03730 [Acidobacteriaceae bacterium]|jgi:hypothetical protein|nr:hypothetical protein [Acidobacteriaceae bacterium]